MSVAPWIFGEDLRYPAILEALRRRLASEHPGLVLDNPHDPVTVAMQAGAWIGHLAAALVDATGAELDPATCRTPEALLAHARRLGVRLLGTIPAHATVAVRLRPGATGELVPAGARFGAHVGDSLITYSAESAAESAAPGVPLGVWRRSGTLVWTADGIVAAVAGAAVAVAADVVPAGVDLVVNDPLWLGLGGELRYEYATAALPPVSPVLVEIQDDGSADLSLAGVGISEGVEVELVELSSGVAELSRVVGGVARASARLARLGGASASAYRARPLWAPLEVTDDGTADRLAFDEEAVGAGLLWSVDVAGVDLDAGVVVRAQIGGLERRGAWSTARGASGVVASLILGPQIVVTLTAEPDAPPSVSGVRLVAPLLRDGRVRWTPPVDPPAAARVALAQVALGSGAPDVAAYWIRARVVAVGDGDGLAVGSGLVAAAALVAPLHALVPVVQGRRVETEIGPATGEAWWSAVVPVDVPEGPVRVFVDGAEWAAVDDPAALAAAGPLDRLALVQRSAAGELVVRFGDGEIGSAPPAGVAVAVEHPVGAELDGRVPAGAISTSIDGLPSIQAVRNPAASTGWAPREVGEGEGDPVFERTRASLPARARAAVGVGTRADIEALAESDPAVGRARAVAGAVGPATVGVYVVGSDGLPVSPEARLALEQRMNGPAPGDGLLRLELRAAVLPAALVSVDVTLHCVRRAGAPVTETQIRAAVAAIVGPVARDAQSDAADPLWSWGEPVAPSRLAAALHDALPGLRRVDVIAPAAEVAVPPAGLPTLGALTVTVA